jgi:hypothetical protein
MRRCEAIAREIIVLDQHDNSTNSKLDRWFGGLWLPLALAFLLGSLVVIEATTYRLGLTGRLHPAQVPMVLVGILVLSGIGILHRGRRDSASAEPEQDVSLSLCIEDRRPVSVRIILACLLSIIILAVCTRSLGVPVSVFTATLMCLFGIAGVSVLRGLLIASAIAAFASGIFVILLRLPLPILPGGILW